jgi:hypothetical protein
MDGIIDRSDAVLIDRGDLSREVPLEYVPYYQKAIVRRANRWSRPVYVATNLLESMVTNRNPTIAEANDVANTLLDGSTGWCWRPRPPSAGTRWGSSKWSPVWYGHSSGPTWVRSWSGSNWPTSERHGRRQASAPMTVISGLAELMRASMPLRGNPMCLTPSAVSAWSLAAVPNPRSPTTVAGARPMSATTGCADGSSYGRVRWVACWSSWSATKPRSHRWHRSSRPASPASRPVRRQAGGPASGGRCVPPPAPPIGYAARSPRPGR